MSGARPTGGEFAWIARLVEVLGDPSRAAIGDDTATMEAEGIVWAWTVDTLVEGVHFRFDWLDPEDVGWRAMVASLSDLAAADAGPAGALVAVAGPPRTVAQRIEGVYRGLRSAGEEAGCAVVGGDLARAEGPLHVTVTALGRVREGRPPGRGGARPGDELWVTGVLGAPAAAIALLSAAKDSGALMAARAHPAYARLARPHARLAEMRWLRERAEIRAAIDVSDGLSGDLAHVAERSGVAAALEADRVPIHPDAANAARARGASALDFALHGGEEFELLLAAPPGALAPHADAFARAFGIPLTRIGVTREGRGVFARTDGNETPLALRSWDHFAGRDAP